jgi:hypothetical protein
LAWRKLGDTKSCALLRVCNLGFALGEEGWEELETVNDALVAQVLNSGERVGPQRDCNVLGVKTATEERALDWSEGVKKSKTRCVSRDSHSEEKKSHLTRTNKTTTP